MKLEMSRAVSRNLISAARFDIRELLTSPPHVDSRTCLARLVRVCCGLVAVACLYSLFVYYGDVSGGGYFTTGVFFLLALTTFGPEAILRKFLPDRDYPIANQAFYIVPWFFLGALAAQVAGSTGALLARSHGSNVFVFVSTVFVCLCPFEFYKLRTAICYVAAASCFAVWWFLGDGLAGSAGFLAFMIGSLPGPRERTDAENLPPRPMQ